jgi:hypothetical protein
VSFANIAPAVAAAPAAFALGVVVGLWIAGRYRLRILGPRRDTDKDGDG